MKKIIMIFALSMACINMLGQTVIETETLKVTDLGNQKLCVCKVDGVTDYYCILLKTGNIYQKYITVPLGERDECIKQLQFLYDLKPKKGTYIQLDNETKNVLVWNEFGYYTVFSEGRILKGRLRKQNIKGFIKKLNQL